MAKRILAPALYFSLLSVERGEPVLKRKVDMLRSLGYLAGDDLAITPKGREAMIDYVTPRARGFAAMSRERVSEIASKGGKSAQASGRGHRFTSEEARAAGKIGGLAKGKRPKASDVTFEGAATDQD